MRTGKCTNFGNCSLADGKQVIQILPGNDLVCPECKRPLTETTPQSRPMNPAILVALIAIVLLGGLT
jgi:phosphate transport system substrate-binding protein